MECRGIEEPVRRCVRSYEETGPKVLGEAVEPVVGVGFASVLDPYE